MTRYAPDGLTSLWWVTTISNTSSPTAAEITAGVNLTAYLAAEGFDGAPSTNLVDAAGLDDVFDAMALGTWGAKPKVTLFRNIGGGGTDTAWNTVPRGTVGYWVLREGVTSATAATAGQKVDIYPSALQQPVKGPLTKNELQKFSSEAAVTSAPKFAVTVA